MKPLTHGGDWAGYRAEFGRDPLDFSANVSPLGLPGGVAKAITASLATADRYPDPLCRALREKLAVAEGVPAEWLLCGNGAADLIFRLALAEKPRTALVTAPTFAEYATALGTVDCRVERHFLREENDFAVTDAILDAVHPGIDLVFLCQPNNPTGQLARPALVEALLRRCEAVGAVLAVDECFLDFLPEGQSLSAKRLLSTSRKLIILKAFTKLYGMAGVRLGYVLANAPVIEELCKVRQPYSVDAVSQAIGEVVFENRARFEPGIREIIEERGRVMEALRTLPGVTAYPSDSNWILFSMEDAGAAWQYLYDRGVLVRDFSSAPMLEGCLRATIGTPEQNDAFIRGLRDFLAESRERRARAMQ